MVITFSCSFPHRTRPSDLIKLIILGGILGLFSGMNLLSISNFLDIAVIYNVDKKLWMFISGTLQPPSSTERKRNNKLWIFVTESDSKTVQIKLVL